MFYDLDSTKDYWIGLGAKGECSLCARTQSFGVPSVALVNAGEGAASGLMNEPGN